MFFLIIVLQLTVPKRGQVLLAMRDALVKNLEPLGKVVSLEMGKQTKRMANVITYLYQY